MEMDEFRRIVCTVSGKAQPWFVVENRYFVAAFVVKERLRSLNSFSQEARSSNTSLLGVALVGGGFFLCHFDVCKYHISLSLHPTYEFYMTGRWDANFDRGVFAKCLGQSTF